MRKSFRAALAALAVAVIMFGSVLPAAAAPVTWQTVDVTLHNEQPSPILLISGTLPDNAKLPAQVELAVPKGAQFQWAGEILGGAPEQDPSVQYTVSEKNGMDVYAFTLKQAKIGQLEVLMPSSIQFDGTNYVNALSWTATSDVPKVNVSVRIPAGAQIAQPAEGASVAPGPTGYSYYQKTVSGAKPGDKVEMAFSYTLPAGAGAGAGQAGAGGSGNSVALVLVVVVFAVGFFLAGTAINRKMKSAQADAAYYEDDEFDEEAADEAAVATDAEYAFEGEDEQAEEPVAAKPAKPKSAASTSKRTATAPSTSRTAAASKRNGGKSTPVAEPPAPAPRASNARWIVAGVVVAGLALAAVLAGQNSTSAQLVNGTYQRNFGATSICTSAEFALSIPQQANQATAADKIFKALEGAPGIGNVTIYVDNPRALVEFCETTTNQQAITTALAASGYLDASAPLKPAQPLSAPGGTPVTPGSPTTTAPAAGAGG